jgi:hypothetical protein
MADLTQKAVDNFILQDYFFDEFSDENSEFSQLIRMKLLEFILDNLKEKEQKEFVSLLEAEAQEDKLTQFLSQYIADFEEKAGLYLRVYIDKLKQTILND